MHNTVYSRKRSEGNKNSLVSDFLQRALLQRHTNHRETGERERSVEIDLQQAGGFAMATGRYVIGERAVGGQFEDSHAREHCHRLFAAHRWDSAAALYFCNRTIDDGCQIRAARRKGHSFQETGAVQHFEAFRHRMHFDYGNFWATATTKSK